jgi:hypothetical protein
MDKEQVYTSKQGAPDELEQHIGDAFATVPPDFIRVGVESGSSRLHKFVQKGVASVNN